MRVEGPSSIYERIADSGGAIRHHFCPVCGATVFWRLENAPGFVTVAIGAFADPSFPAPQATVYDELAHEWTETLRDAIPLHE